MASTDIISYSIRTIDGDVKSLPYYVPSGGTIAGAQALADVTAPLLDAAIDGVIESISLTISLTVPSGMKTTPNDANTVHVGALLDYSTTGSDYSFGAYIPSWKNAGFSGREVNNTGPYADVITDLNQYVDKYGDALDTFQRGKRRTRK